MRAETKMVHGSSGVNRDADPLTTPIYETTTFLFENAVEGTIAALEGTETAMLLSSGMAATATALLALLSSGDEVVCSAAIYGGTLHLLADLFPHYGIKPRFVTTDQLRAPEELLGDKTKIL